MDREKYLWWVVGSFIVLAGCTQAPAEQPVNLNLPAQVKATATPTPVITSGETFEIRSKSGEAREYPLVTPGARCSVRGQQGASRKGEIYTCKGRWRK